MNWVTKYPDTAFGGGRWQGMVTGDHKAVVRFMRNRWTWNILADGRMAYVATGWCKTEAAAKVKAEAALAAATTN